MSFGEQWRTAKTNDFEPEKGTYKVKIIRGGANLSNAGDPKANVYLEIIEGPDAGEIVDHFMWMAHEVSRAINKEALLAYGLNDEGIESIEDLDSRIQQLIGRTAEVGISYKDGRMNIRVTGSRAAEGQAPDISGKPVADFATAAASNGVDDDTPPF